ncbi:MAG TPA: DNA polymerase IV [Candidatus Avidesulfovibrio excrementigallinarum]|nr:DNA polymerase IV [Candidatus Avidesulfovibrio excrementigallinarum]
MHVDMDAFYASIEQHDFPALRGRPVIVGGGLRGVVSAASYEVRRYGVHSAMPLWQARRLCPHAVVQPVRMARYVEISRQVQAVLHRFSPRVEQASVDEAYLDATGLERLFGPVDVLARAIKQAVFEATDGLTCSVGLAPVKFLAKIASDRDKPDGLTILFPEQIDSFLHTLPVCDIPGVGKTFLENLRGLGIHTCGDVRQRPQSFWERRFGKAGVVLWQRAQGLDPREVEPQTPPKSESAENTFDEDTLDKDVLRGWLFRQADRVGRSLRRQRLCGRVVTLKVKYADFKRVSRQMSLPEPTCATQTIYEAGCRLLDALDLVRPVRLIGLGVSHFEEGRQQGFLPEAVQNHEQEVRRTRLDQTLDALGGKVVRGRLFVPRDDS